MSNQRGERGAVVVGIGGLSGRLSGVERINVQVHDALQASRHAVTWKVTSEGVTTSQRESWSGAAVGRTLRLLVSLARSLRGRPHPDALYLPVSQKGPGLLRDCALVLLSRLLCPGVVIVGHLHGEYEVGPNGRSAWWIGSLYRYLASRCHLVSCIPGGALAERSSIYVPNSLDQTDADEIDRVRARSDRTAALFMAAGPFTQAKGFVTLIEAWRLAELPERARLLIYATSAPGPAAQLPVVRAWELAAEMRNIEVREPVYGPARFEEFGTANILVLPSHSEGAPMLLLEALRAGQSIVATDVGAVCGMLTEWGNDRCRIVAAADARALARSLEQAAEDPAAPVSRPLVPIGSTGRGVVEALETAVRSRGR